MSHEPKKPIEPLLEAYAKKRRDEAGAPLELHPVNRRHLQDAVAEMRGSASATSAPSAEKTSFWAGWKFPFMVGLSFTSVLFICGLVWLRNHSAPEKESVTEMARLSQTPAPEESSVGKKSAAASSPEHMVLADQTLSAAQQAPASNAFFALEKDSARRDLAAAAPASTIAPTGSAAPLPASPVPVASPVVTTVAVSGVALAENKLAARSAGQLEQKQSLPPLQAMDRKRDELAAAPAKSIVKLEAAKPAAKEAEVTLALGEAIKSKNFAVEFQNNGAGDGFAYKNSNLKSFSQTAPVEGLRRNFNSPPPPVVLQNFYMERSGNALRVIDADGSTYVGVVGVGDAPVALQIERAKKITSERSLAESRQQESETKYRKAAAPMPAAKGGEENQRLYFEVNGLNRTLNQNVLLNGSLVLTQQLQLTVTNTNNPASQSLPVSQVQGRATVGKTQFDLNAVPATGK
ncbi:MAG TPA: hypothetical protein VK968_05995 [Roseimicrobium sp.]|nr:hypothetical protein [Roseimicrobium sp.]